MSLLKSFGSAKTSDDSNLANESINLNTSQQKEECTKFLYKFLQNEKKKNCSLATPQSNKTEINSKKVDTDELLQMSIELLKQKYQNNRFFRKKLDIKMQNYCQSRGKKSNRSIYLGTFDQPHQITEFINSKSYTLRAIRVKNEMEVEKVQKLYQRYQQYLK